MTGRALAAAMLGLAVSASAWAPGAWAQGAKPASPRAAYDACLGKAEGRATDIAACSNAQADRIEKDLNSVYARLRSEADGDLKAALEKSQRAWIAYREAHCGYKFQTEFPGLMSRLMAANCRLQLIEDRLADLRKDL